MIIKFMFFLQGLEELVLIKGKLDFPKEDFLVMWHRLRRLVISFVRIEDEVFGKIIASCKMIEYLEVDGCEGFTWIRVINHGGKLKKLYVYPLADQSVEVDAINLETFVCRTKYHFASERNTCEMNLPKYQCLKNFTLGGMGITSDFFRDFSNKFPCIEHLEVHACRCLQMLEFSCHSLKSFSLECNTKLNEICLDIPNINFFQYKGYLPRLSFTFTLGPWTSEITIDMSLSDLGASWFLKFKEFLANFVDSDVSVFLDNIEKVSLNVEETKNDALELPLPGILSMLVGIYCPYLVPKYSIILDALLWGFRPKIFTCYWTNLANSRFTKFAYDKLVTSGRDEEDDDSQEIELWKPHLKGVKVEVFKETKRVLEPEPLDWIALSKLSPIVHAPRRFCFTLDWATSS